MKTEKRKLYHHGSLFDSLVEFALKRIRTRGLGGFSLREAAREIGVSPGAAYRHFKARDDLLSEVSGQGYSLLTESMALARSKAPNIREELIAVGMAYVSFAENEPHLFTLMFSPLEPRIEGTILTIGSAAIPYNQLAAALNRYLDQGSTADTIVHCDYLWAVAHGISTLQVSKHWAKSQQEIRGIFEKSIAQIESNSA